jgi:hypothetical protein
MSSHSPFELSLRDDTAQQLYLALLKGVLTRTIVHEQYAPMDISHYGPTKKVYKLLFSVIKRIFNKKGLEIVRRYKPDWENAR